jgi:hypothetical protein
MMASSSREVNSHGTKRPAPDELEGEQRLAKRFNLLNLGTFGERMFPSPPKCRETERSLIRGSFLAEHHGKLYIPVDNAPVTQPPQQNADNEFMEVEDTKHKVYIYDLDKELAEEESDEDRPIFLPDIEKHLHKIPKHILIGDDAKAMANMQMVLYNVPTSLTVPVEQDSVHRAIAESRQRTRARQGIGELHTDSNSSAKEESHSNNGARDSMATIDSAPSEMEDSEAMELD